MTVTMTQTKIHFSWINGTPLPSKVNKCKMRPYSQALMTNRLTDRMTTFGVSTDKIMKTLND